MAAESETRPPPNLGDIFHNWNDFEQYFNAYCKGTHQVFITFDSKTVATANKSRKKLLPECLKYSFVKLTCTHLERKKSGPPSFQRGKGQSNG
jgi:hypothetical protein